MMAVCVDPARVHEAWPHFKHWIKNALDRGTTDFSVHEKDVLEGRCLLWLAYDGERVHAAATTQLVGGVCEIVGCGGEGLSQWLPLIENIEAFARDEKCSAVRLIGRSGWQRILKDYKQTAIILERPL